MKSLEELMHEHRVIEHSLAVLDTMADRLERGEAVPIEKVTALLDFFEVFAHKCHHGKEEEMLFPELESRGIPREGGPIGVMLYEHEQGEAYQSQLRESLVNLSDPTAKQHFVQTARGYADLLRQHIWKEDNVLFKMAEEVLTESARCGLEKSGEGATFPIAALPYSAGCLRCFKRARSS